jgi:chromosome segregation ATPase
MGELWWLPSLVVFGIAAASAVVVIAHLGRRARKRAIRAHTEADERRRNAAVGLVRADDAVLAATDELGFAVAQFGDDAAHGLRSALEASRRDLRDAFALQQKLDDATPDSTAVSLRWIDEISSLTERATERLQQQTGHLAARRGVERNAPAALEALRRRLDELGTRTAAADARIAGLSSRYADEAIAGLRSALQAARTAQAEARSATDAAASRQAASDPVGDQLAAAERAVYQATRSLDSLDTLEAQLGSAAAAVEETVANAESGFTEARSLRDRHEEPEARGALNRAIAQAEEELGRLADPARPANPHADLVALREVLARLDRAHADARNRQLRLENARAALGGALLAAESQIAVTRDFIGDNRSWVGAAARTRLAEAERQLGLARAEADPVTALDTARRAMTHATDADALARFDSH